jgi:hypothetical protein
MCYMCIDKGYGTDGWDAVNVSDGARVFLQHVDTRTETLGGVKTTLVFFNEGDATWRVFIKKGVELHARTGAPIKHDGAMY